MRLQKEREKALRREARAERKREREEAEAEAIREESFQKNFEKNLRREEQRRIFEMDRNNARMFKLMRLEQKRDFLALKTETLEIEAGEEVGKSETWITNRREVTRKVGRWRKEWAKFQGIPRNLPNSLEQVLLFDRRNLLLSAPNWLQKV